MPIMHDYECPFCGEVFEALAEWDQSDIECNECGHIAHRCFKPKSEKAVTVTDPDWIRSVHVVVDKANPAHHVQEFLKHPTRSNLNEYMKKEGIRHIEPGEKIAKPEVIDIRRHVDSMMKKRMSERAIAI